MPSATSEAPMKSDPDFETTTVLNILTEPQLDLAALHRERLARQKDTIRSDVVIPELDDEYQQTSFTIIERPSSGIGHQLWALGTHACLKAVKLYKLQQQDCLKQLQIQKNNHNHTIIELGCGTGVLGMAIVRLLMIMMQPKLKMNWNPQFNLYLTDIEDSIETTKKNVERNREKLKLKPKTQNQIEGTDTDSDYDHGSAAMSQTANVFVQPLDWLSEKSYQDFIKLLPINDIKSSKNQITILASECVYHPKYVNGFFDTLEKLMTLKTLDSNSTVTDTTDSEVFLSFGRDRSDGLYSSAEKMFFDHSLSSKTIRITDIWKGGSCSDPGHDDQCGNSNKGVTADLSTATTGNVGHPNVNLQTFPKNPMVFREYQSISSLDNDQNSVIQNFLLNDRNRWPFVIRLECHSNSNGNLLNLLN